MKKLAPAIFLLFLSSSAFAREAVIFDTDSAFLNDDGLALSALLSRPDLIDVVGVTVESGNVWRDQGVEYDLALLERLGRADLPVYLGAVDPLKNSPARAAETKKRWGAGFQGALAQPKTVEPPFGGAFAKRRPEKKAAVDFLIETIRARPGEITVFAAGPMTDLALAFRKAPDLPGKIKRLVFMGGAAQAPGNTTTAAEFNFWFDPEAARAVIAAPVASKLMFPLDATNKVKLTETLAKELVERGAPLSGQLREDLARYPGFFSDKPHRDWVYIWDFLVSAWLIDPSAFGAPKPGLVVVDDRFGPSYGRSDVSFKPGGEERAAVDVVVDVDEAKALALLSSLFPRKER